MIPLTLLPFSASASAFDSDHCWNLSVCPGSPNSITDQNPTFFTYLNTGTRPIGHYATVWVVHYNDAVVTPISVQQLNFPGNPLFNTRMLPSSPADLTNPNAECLTCDRDLTVIWEDLFDNGFQLPVSSPSKVNLTNKQGVFGGLGVLARGSENRSALRRGRTARC